MTNRFAYRFRPLTVLGLALASAATFAEPTAVSDAEIEEMVVVAHHTPIPSHLVGSSVSVLDTQDFADRISFDPSALFRNLPSLNLSQTGTFGSLTSVRLRGSESNHTLVLINGIEANDPANGAAFDLSQLAGTSIDRIEVLRGPQSARYGAEAIGGVIAIYTRPTGSSDLSEDRALTLGLETGSHGFHQGNLNADVIERVGAAVSRSQFSMTRAITNGSDASFYGSESDGYRNRTWSADSSLRWNDGSEIGLSARETRTNLDTDPQDFAFHATPTQGLVIDGDNNTAARQRLVGLHGRMTSGSWLHELKLSHNASKTRSRVNGEDDSGLKASLRKADWTASRDYESGKFSHSLALGIQYEQRRFRNFNAALPSANHKARDKQLSQFAEYLVRNDTRSVSISARRDQNDRFDNLTTWRVTGTQALLNQVRVHASWGEGSANPTFFELFGFIPESFAGNPDLKPESSEGWDLGLSGADTDGRYAWDLTYFRSRLNNEIITSFGPAPDYFSQPINLDGTSRREGWEASLTTDVSEQITVDANFTLLDSHEPGGRREVRRPRRSGAINTHLAFANEQGKASLSFIYNGEMHDSEFITATPTDRVVIKSVTLLNAGVSYRPNERTTLFFRGQNLLNKEYQQVFSFRAPGVTASVGVMVTLR